MTPLLAALALASPLFAYDDFPVARFSATPVRSEITVEVTVGYLRAEAGRQNYWFRKTVRRGSAKLAETLWTDTKTCPGAPLVLEGLAAFTPPKLSIPGYDGLDGNGSVRDGIEYRLEADAAAYLDGHMVLTSNMETPLAEWIDGALEKLAPCWSRNTPEGLAS